MLSLTLLMLMLGVANWFATTLIVESELFRPLRDFPAERYNNAVAKESHRGAAFWSKIRYLVGCHMCTGTWVGLAMALFVPWVVGGFAGYLMTALVIKGIGHLVLMLVNMGEAAIERYRAQATEAMMGALPDMGSLLGGLMDRHESRVDAANERNKQGRRNQAGAYMFPDKTFAVPKKNRPKFEPFNEGDLLEPTDPEVAWNKPEKKL